MKTYTGPNREPLSKLPRKGIRSHRWLWCSIRGAGTYVPDDADTCPGCEQPVPGSLTGTATLR